MLNEVYDEVTNEIFQEFPKAMPEGISKEISEKNAPKELLQKSENRKIESNREKIRRISQIICRRFFLGNCR